MSLQLSKASSLRQDTSFLKFHPMYSDTLLPQHPSPPPQSWFPQVDPASAGAGVVPPHVQDLLLPLWDFQRFLSAHLSQLSRPLWMKGCTALRGSPLLQTFYHSELPEEPSTSQALPVPLQLPAHITSPVFITIPADLSFLTEQENKKKTPGGLMPNYAGILQRAWKTTELTIF